MKKLNYFLIVSVLLGFILTTSCKKDKDDEPKINESEVLATFLESSDSPYGKDFVNTDMPTIMSATDVNNLNLTGQVYIIDMRAANDFANGHIENAVNVPIAQLYEHIKTINMANYEKIALVCYTGQTAAYGASLMRLMGYNKVFSMKWGMCSWNADFSGGWNNAIGNSFASQFVTTPTEKAPAGEMPSLNTGKTTGLEILEARVATLLSEGYGNGVAAVTNQTVFGNLGNYYIVNYWPKAQYDDPGHIPGAIQYTPKESMKIAADLKTLPTDKAIVLYCYTGQTSSFLAAYLRLLGYDAKSLLFGGNGMIYDIMTEKGMTTFKASEIMGYDYIKP
jgi:rhodanese-related sulfurtransferase